MKKLIPVWDLPMRLFHWSLVIAVFYSWFSIEVLENMQQHFYAGYTVLTLLLFRLVWGLIGPGYARFRSFIFTFREIGGYAKTLLSRSQLSKGTTYIGHNPLGGVSALVMIGLLLAQAVLGLFSSDDYYFGPLSGLIDTGTIALTSQLHSVNSNVVFSMIGLHIAAIAYYKFSKKQDLTKAMITGRRLFSEPVTGDEGWRPLSNLLALITLFICIVAVVWLATAFLDRLPTSTESYY